MEIGELMQAVHAEGLDAPVVYGDRPLRNDAVVLEKLKGAWKVYIAHERGGPIESTMRIFDNESDAISHVLLKLRQRAEARRLMSALPDWPRRSASIDK